jgi:hypothetical protein
MWFWDYLNLDRDDICTEAWEAFDTWKKAYTHEHPDLAGVGDLDLVENHYKKAMEPVFDSWLFKAWYLFYLPSMTLRAIAWRLKLKLHFYLINQINP